MSDPNTNDKNTRNAQEKGKQAAERRDNKGVADPENLHKTDGGEGPPAQKDIVQPPYT